MLKRNLKAQVLLLGCLLLGSFEASAYFDNIKEFRLDNGLKVVLWENHRAPVVKQMIFYKTGAVDENIGKGGLAHLLEHLMFRGTQKLAGNAFNDLMEKNGAVSNAYTAQDVTAYHQMFDVSRLDIVMAAEADRMQNLNFDKEAFAAEQQIVLEERKQRVDNNPAAKFYETVRKNLWQDHPYARQVAGEQTEISSLQLDDVKEFYNRYYAPNNAVLVLSGDIGENQARQLAQKYYGDIKSQEITPTIMPDLPEGYKASIAMALPDVKMPRFIMAYVVPSFNYKPEMVYAFDVLGEYLGGDKNSPFYQRMVLQNKRALSVDVSYNPYSRSAGVFEITAAPRNKADDDFRDAVIRGLDYAMYKLDNEQLSMVKDKIIANLIYAEDGIGSVAELLGTLASRDIDLQNLTQYEENIRKVTLDDVRKAFTYLQTTAPQVVGMLNPKEN